MKLRGWTMGLVVATAALVGGVPTARAEQDHFEVGAEVPVFTLKAVNTDDSGANYVGVDSYFGASATEAKKGVLLSFFATYCEPCKREMPFLATLYDTYKDKGLMILSISIDKEADKIDFIKNLAKESGVKFPVLSDRFNIVAKRYMISRLPCIYLIGPDGKVTMASVGYNDDISSQIIEGVRTLVGEPTTDPLPEALAKFIVAHGAGEAGVEHGGEAAAAADESAAQDKSGKADKRKRGKRAKRGKRGKR